MKVFFMKINEIIKEKRNEIGITQEQMAKSLGVSTPAVNKWEKGVSYPDITLLPAIARLLKTDLNTLMSFKDDLTEQEITNFTNELAESLKKDGFSAVYEMAMKKINEYPCCDKLIRSVAMILEGAMIMLGVNNKEKYESEIEKLYERISNSDDIEASSSAKTMLISKYTNRGEFEKAQNMIDSLSPMDEHKNEYQAELYFKQGKVDEACRLIEIQLKRTFMMLYLNLSRILRYNLKSGDEESAEYYKDIIVKTVSLYDMGEQMAYMTEAEFYADHKDEERTLESIRKVIQSLPKMRKTYDSVLCKHIYKDFHMDDKKKKDFSDMIKQYKRSIINAVQNDEKFDFLKGNEEFKKMFNEEENIKTELR